MQVWILTFNRPVALSRLIRQFAEQGHMVNILSNHPEVKFDHDLHPFVDKLIINTLNSAESNSWCARSWNTILMKAFDEDDEAILIQDDTSISHNFFEWFNQVKLRYDFIWGPAGDQFHYLKKKVWQQVGWWDERYIGCYCADADYLKRVFMEYDRNKLSVSDSHNWGFKLNPEGIEQHVITTYQAKTVDPNYDNQHWEFERRCKDNPTLQHSQSHFRAKWGVELDNNQPVVYSTVRKFKEIDWYPWFSIKHNMSMRRVTDVANIT